MMPKVIILSPHCDDAPLSLGAALLNRSFGTDPLVAVVFSVSCFTKDQPCTGRVDQVTALRHSEEILASQKAGYSVQFLGFPEPFVRSGFESFSDIFDSERHVEEDTVWPKVNTALQMLFQNHRGLLIVPLACGDHIDHRIVRHCALDALAGGARFAIGFYEDLPYSAVLRDSQILARLPYLKGNSLSPMLFDHDLVAKLDLLATYKSQLRSGELVAVKKHWHRVGGERLWLAERARLP